ncbi:MAG TPA: hypothetical protein VKE69_06690 [Planctomycetota bacterium]|nr:hypothetical protein [Planctomycetota bacterium]
MSSQRRLGWLLPALLAAPASAQGPFFYDEERFRVSASDALDVTAGFGRTVVAHLTGEGSPDVVVLAGDRPLLFTAPQVHQSVRRVPESAVAGPVLDLDVAKGKGVDGGDAIAMVNSVGLVHWWWSHANVADATSVIATGPWAGARKLRTADLQGLGKVDYVGVGAAGDTILVRLEGAAATTTVLAAGGAVQAIDVLDFDGASPLDIAYLVATSPTTSAVRVVTTAGASLLPSPIAGEIVAGYSDSIAALRMPGTAPDRLAWITTASSPSVHQVIRVVQTGGLVSDDVDLTGAIHAVQCSASDLDGDGRSDLLISVQGGEFLLAYFNVGASPAPTFHSNFAIWTPYGNAMPNLGNVAWPAGADFDGDGDGDWVLPVERTQELVLFRNRGIDETRQKVKPEVQHPGDVWSFVDDNHLAVPLAKPQDPVPGATHVQVTIWRQPTYDDPIDPRPVGSLVAALTPSGTGGYLLENPKATVTLPGGPYADECVFTLEIRLIEKQGADLVRAYPAFLGSFSKDDDVMARLEQEFCATCSLFTGVEHSVLLGQFPVGGVLVGGTVPRPRLKAAAPGTVPGPTPK